MSIQNTTLSANLKDEVNNKLDKSNVVNNLNTTSTGYALDARQGKELNDKIIGITNYVVDEYIDTSDTLNIRRRQWSNGIMEIWVSGTIQACILTPYGNIFVGSYTWEFPTAFIDNNVFVSCNLFKWGAGSSWPVGPASVSKRAANIEVNDMFSRSMGSCKFSAYAMGYYK